MKTLTCRTTSTTRTRHQGTGFYGFPMVPAAKIALGTVRRWLEAPGVLDRVDRVVFCTFTDLEMTAYTALWPHFFP